MSIIIKTKKRANMTNKLWFIAGSESDLNRKHAKNFHSQLCMDLAAILDELGTGHIGNYLVGGRSLVESVLIELTSKICIFLKYV